MDFKKFFEQTQEQEKNVKDTLKKIPKSHRNLIRGYKINWECDNVLKGDGDHVGIINAAKKTVTICAPYRYGREYTLLHELAHQVWARLPPELKENWRTVVKKNPKRDKKQDAEENFAMAYADYYCSNKLLKNNHPAWIEFIKNLPK